MDIQALSRLVSANSVQGTEIPVESGFVLPGKGPELKANAAAIDATDPLLQVTEDRSFDFGSPAVRLLGAAFPGGHAGFLMFPLGGGPDQGDEGTEVTLPTLFYSRTFESQSLGNGVGALGAAFTGTLNADGGVQLGGGGAVRVGPLLAFANTRRVGDVTDLEDKRIIPNEDGDWYSTINFGLCVSLNDMVASGSRAGATIAGLMGGPVGLKAAAGLEGLAGFAEFSKKAANTFVGFGYGIQLEGNVNNPGEYRFTQGGREIDLESTIEQYMSTLSGESPDPIFFPEDDDTPDEIRSINDIIALAYGESPFERAQQRLDGSAVPAVELAREADFLVRTTGAAFFPLLSPEAQAIVAHGPKSLEEVGFVLREFWNRPGMSQELRDDIANTLTNPYGIDFGLPEIAARNEDQLPPPDFDATRSVFGIE